MICCKLMPRLTMLCAISGRMPTRMTCAPSSVAACAVWMSVFATYQKRNFAAWNELFKFTDTDMLRAGLFVSPVSWFIISAYAARSFVWVDGAPAYQGTWSAGASLGVRYAFEL